MKTANKQRRPAELPAGVDRGGVSKTKQPVSRRRAAELGRSRENKIVGMRLTPTELEAVEGLIRMGYYRTVSHVLRDGLEEIFEKHKLKLDARVKIRLERLHHPMRRAKRKAVDA